MIKGIINLIIFLSLFLTIKAQNNGIKFENDIQWNSILKKAKEENKYIFLYCFTSWCEPCLYMSKRIFPNEKVGDFYNKNFINVKLQFELSATDSAEYLFNYKSEELINNKYKIKSYPTYLFFNSDGKIIHRDNGSSDEVEFISKGINALDSNLQYYTQINHYKQGIRDSLFLKKISFMALHADDDSLASKYTKEYILSKTNVITSTEDLQLIFEATGTASDTGFILILNNLARFEHLIGKTRLANKMKTIIAQYEYSHYYQKWLKWNNIQWESYSKYLQKIYAPYDQDALFEIKRYVFQKQDNWENFYNTVESYRIKHSLNNSELNEYAWNVFKNCNNLKIVNKSLKWSKYSFKNKNKIEPSYIETYANLLYKLGRKKSAIKWEGKAQRIAQINGSNEDWGQDTLDKMKSGLKTW